MTIDAYRVPSPEAGDYGGVAAGEVSCPLLDTALDAAADPTLDTVRETPLRAGPDTCVPGVAPGEEPPPASALVPASEATDPPRAPDSSSTWDPPPIDMIGLARVNALTILSAPDADADHTVTRVSRNIRDMSRITSIQQQTLLEAAVRFGLHMLSQLSQDALDRVSDSITLHDGEMDTTLAQCLNCRGG